MNISVHQSAWAASALLFISFFTGWGIVVCVPDTWLSHEYLTKLWLIWCLLPLCWVAYWQNPYRLRDKLNPINKKRILGKIKVLALQVIIILLGAACLSLIGNGSGYVSFVMDMLVLLPVIIIALPCYVYFSDRRLAEPNDEYAQLALMLSQEQPYNRLMVKKFMLKTAVKVVFIPFMYSGFLADLMWLLNTSWDGSLPSTSVLLFNIGVNLDMLVAIFGYLISSSLINNQIVDTDDHLLGWIVALLCYPPLQTLRNQISSQTDNLIWSDIIPADTIWYWLMFLAINLSWIVYWLATFEFGMGFSNLSWRKLVNTGVYRYTKHPAYVAKNLYWWLHTLPFCGVVAFSANWWENMLTLLSTSLIYYGRACSEERHLMKFPEYQAYAEHISQHGIFRKIKLPWIK